MDKLEAKKCPICGSVAKVESGDMGRPGGHGYPGNTYIIVKCSKCRLVESGGSDTVYGGTFDNAYKFAIERWNENVDKTIELMQGGILKEKTGRYEYDVNKLEKTLETYRPYVIKKLRADLDLEIMGIETIMEFCDDEQIVSKVARRIGRIKKLFQEELNEKKE